MDSLLVRLKHLLFLLLSLASFDIIDMSFIFVIFNNSNNVYYILVNNKKFVHPNLAKLIELGAAKIK